MTYSMIMATPVRGLSFDQLASYLGRATWAEFAVKHGYIKRIGAGSKAVYDVQEADAFFELLKDGKVEGL